LQAPKLRAEALHFPGNGPGNGPIALPASSGGSGPGGAAVELRAGLEYSPTDAIRGKLLTSVGDADCLLHGVAAEIDEVLLQATDRSELAARSAEAEHLSARRSDWQRQLSSAQNALAAGLLTLAELYELRRSTHALEQRWLDAELEVARLRARLEGQAEPRGALDRQYVARAQELELASSKLRTLDAWSLNLTGGVATLADQRPEWFGFAEVSYSLGGLLRGSQESDYQRARAEELRQAPYERPHRLAMFRKLVGAEYENARRKLESTEADLSLLESSLAAFTGVDAPSADRGRTLLLIDRIGAEADAVFLRTKLRELVRLLERLRDS